MIRHLLAVIAIALLLGVSCAPGSASQESIRIGRGIYGDRCSTCHGNRGQGGVGPSLSDVRKTFPSCADQLDWITLGSEAWKVEVGLAYGANETPITRVMPGFAQTLTPDDIAAVAAFERVEYGDGDPIVELGACGLAPE